MDAIGQFYDAFSEYYHLIFEDWGEERRYQAEKIDSIISSLKIAGRVL